MPTPAEVIGRRIRERLDELDLSVPSFAAQVGVSVQAANRWVRGEALPNIDRWHDIALILDLPWDALFNPQEDV